MSITLANFQKEIPAAYIKEGKKLFTKNAVRELDEEPGGVHIAYVDEGNNSFDVQLTVDGAGAVTTHQCDCKSTYTFCKHKIAVLFQLTEAGKEVKKKATGKKVSPAGALLQSLDVEQLRGWVLGVLQKHKDLELSFINFFSAGNTLPDPDTIKEQLEAAVKAVLKTRKKAEQAELKKITDLWTDITQPVIDRCCRELNNHKSTDVIYAMVETCRFYNNDLKFSGVKITRFTEYILDKTADALTALQEHAAWQETVAAICGLAVRDKKYLHLHFIQLLMHSAEKSSPERQLHITAQLAALANTPQRENPYSKDEFLKLFLPFVINANLFEQYHTLFAPIRYSNAYNELLISNLTDIKRYKTAIAYCQAQIEENYREEYNIPYWNALKRIYELQNDNKKLVEVLRLLLPYTFNIKDYNKVFSSMPPSEERNKWRTKIFTRARKYDNGKHTLDFCFQLLKQEGQYKKMLGLVDSYTPFAVYIHYFNELYAGDKNELLRHLIEKQQSWKGNDDSTGPLLDEVAALVKKHYPEIAIRAFATKEDRWTYSRMPLKEYFRKVYDMKSDG